MTLPIAQSWSKASSRLGDDPSLDRPRLLENLVVAEAQHGQSVGGHDRVAHAIAFNSILVDRTIDLDDESSLSTVEVSDELADWLLATELQPSEATTT